MKRRIPKLCRHRGGGYDRAFVRDPRTKKQIYFGPWGSKEAVNVYNEWVEEYSKSGGDVRPRASSGKPKTLAGVLERWLVEVESKCRKADGSFTGEIHPCRRAAAVAVECGIAEVDLSDLTRNHLIKMRDHLVRQGLARESVNGYVTRVVRSLSFAEQREWIDTAHYLRLRQWEKLRHGVAPAEREMRVIPKHHLRAIYLALPEKWKPIFELHLFTGCRAENAITAKASEIDRKHTPWAWSPEQHKGRWRGHGLRILIGPRARAAIQPDIDRAGKRAGLLWTDKEGQPIKHYQYRQAFERACIKANLPSYMPREIRHTAASFLVNQGIPEAVIGSILGHRPGTITARYAKVSDKKRAEVVEKFG
jgi:integrase